jgi:hypothetical protein
LLALQGAIQLPLLAKPAVLDDLGLAETQRDGIRTLSERLTKRFREFHRLSPEQRQQRFLEAQANAKELEKILSLDQRRRLHQIALQLQGPFAFHETEVEAGLKLTANQKERIAAILFGVGDGMCHEDGGPKKRTTSLDGIVSNLASASEQIQTLLTPEQARKWQEMKGEPFKGQVSMDMRPGPFGPPLDGSRGHFGDPPPFGRPRGRGPQADFDGKRQ